MIESGREYVCADCGQEPIWNNKPLTLQVDHKNGIRTDNRPENLRFLCPNCHTQTPTFAKVKLVAVKRCEYGAKSKVGRCIKCTKEQRRNTAPSLEVLRQLIWQYPATIIAKQYNVSDKAVAKWCQRYGLSKPNPGYWMKNRGCGGTGRRTAFREQRAQAHEGSTPFTRTVQQGETLLTKQLQVVVDWLKQKRSNVNWHTASGWGDEEDTISITELTQRRLEKDIAEGQPYTPIRIQLSGTKVIVTADGSRKEFLLNPDNIATHEAVADYILDIM